MALTVTTTDSRGAICDSDAGNFTGIWGWSKVSTPPAFDSREKQNREHVDQRDQVHVNGIAVASGSRRTSLAGEFHVSLPFGGKQPVHHRSKFWEGSLATQQLAILHGALHAGHP